MTGLIVLLIAGVLVIGTSDSRQGKWAGFAIVGLSALAIVSITVTRALELKP